MVNAKARRKVGGIVCNGAESRIRQDRAGTGQERAGQAVQGKAMQGRKSIGLGRAG